MYNVPKAKSPEYILDIEKHYIHQHLENVLTLHRQNPPSTQRDSYSVHVYNVYTPDHFDKSGLGWQSKLKLVSLR